MKLALNRRGVAVAAATAGILTLGVLAAVNESRPQAGFPNASDTGVPSGTTLTAYTGPCAITADGTVIDSKTVDNCPSGLAVHARNVTIRKSKVNTHITTDADPAYSVTVADSEIAAGVVDAAAVGSTNVTVHRSEITGGKHSVACTGNCVVQDSWLHGQQRPTETAGAGWALAALFTPGPPAGKPLNLTAIRNTMTCDVDTTPAGGCTANVNLSGASISGVLLDANLLRASPGLNYCLHGGDAARMVVRNNVFERGSGGQCGGSGAATGWNSAGAGNAWSNNTYDNGATVNPPVPAAASCALPAYPTPSCTGVPAGTVLTELPLNTEGVAYATYTDGDVIDGKHIAGHLLVRGNNVVIRNSQIDGWVQNDVFENGAWTFKSYTIEDSTVGPPTGCITAPGLGYSNYTARRVEIRNMDDGFRITDFGNVDVRDSFARMCYNPPEIAPPDGSHSGGWQADCATGCSNIVMNHNTIDNSQPEANSGITMQSMVDNPVSNVETSDNLIMGGGYTVIYWWTNGPNYEIHNNRVVNGSWAFGPVDTLSTCENQNWSGNTLVTLDGYVPRQSYTGNYTITSTVGPLNCVD